MSPVVVFSSSEAETDRQEALRLGANRYITKPSNLDAFLNIVRF
jgi:DNA-binding response OmpR family regulator